MNAHRLWMGLLLALTAFAYAAAQPKREVRAVWVATVYGLDWPSCAARTGRDVRRQQDELRRLLDRCVEANLNTVMLQVRLRGDVAYRSDLESPAECFDPKGSGRMPYDPLAFAINECHRRGLELHAWMVTMPLGSDRLVRRQGGRSVVRRRPALCVHHHGEWFLNPGEPAARDYLTRLATEVAERYDVDGIHLDYIRYPDRPQGFADDRTYRTYGQGQTLADWRRGNLTALVESIAHAVRSRKPWLKLTCATLGRRADGIWNAYHTVYQDAERWLHEGWVDGVTPMLYVRDEAFFGPAFDWLAHRHNGWMIPGLGLYRLDTHDADWDAADIERQIYTARLSGMNGQALYRARYLADDVKSICRRLATDLYACPALPPATPRAGIDAPLPPHSLRTYDDGTTTHLSWEPSPTAAEREVRYVVYASDTWPVPTHEASCIVGTYVGRPAYAHRYTYPTQRRRFYAVSTLDRYGQESEPLQQPKPEPQALTARAGGALHLPSASDAREATFSDVCGLVRARMPYASVLHLPSTLPAGCYRLRLTGRDGTILAEHTCILTR